MPHESLHRNPQPKKSLRTTKKGGLQRSAVSSVPEAKEYRLVQSFSNIPVAIGKLQQREKWEEKEAKAMGENTLTREEKTITQRKEHEASEIVQLMEGSDDETETLPDPETEFGEFAYAVIRREASNEDLVIGGDSKGKMMYVWDIERQDYLKDSQHLRGNEHIHLIAHKMSVHLVYTYKPEGSSGPNWGKEHDNDEYTILAIGDPTMPKATPEAKTHLIRVAKKLKNIVTSELARSKKGLLIKKLIELK